MLVAWRKYFSDCSNKKIWNFCWKPEEIRTWWMILRDFWPLIFWIFRRFWGRMRRLGYRLYWNGLTTKKEVGIKFWNVKNFIFKNWGFNFLDIDIHRYQPISRRKIAERLSPEISPKFAALLLCSLDHYLEAALYVDYFNDFRSNLILRYLTDIRHG